MTKPNPLHVTVTEHAQPHAAICRSRAYWFSAATPVEELVCHYQQAQQGAKELNAAADYIERLEAERDRFKVALQGVVSAELAGSAGSSDSPYRQAIAAAIRATGERER